MQNKDKTIREIVRYLQANLGEAEVQLTDYWDLDNFAIGLTDRTKGYVVYISTLGMKDGKFYVSLESPPTDDTHPYTPAGDLNNVTLIELEQIVRDHFKITVR